MVCYLSVFEYVLLILLCLLNCTINDRFVNHVFFKSLLNLKLLNLKIATTAEVTCFTLDCFSFDEVTAALNSK